MSLRVEAHTGPVGARLGPSLCTLVNPWVIAFVGAGLAATVAGLTQGALVPLLVPVAFLAGWSAAWSP